jgi:hypothetical protein
MTDMLDVVDGTVATVAAEGIGQSSSNAADGKQRRLHRRRVSVHLLEISDTVNRQMESTIAG